MWVTAFARLGGVRCLEGVKMDGVQEEEKVGGWQGGEVASKDAGQRCWTLQGTQKQNPQGLQEAGNWHVS